VDLARKAESENTSTPRTTKVKIPFDSSRTAPEPPAAKETKAWPFCGEDILQVAIKCKHCGEFLSGERTLP
jgi:hypothetical protein